MGTAWLTNGQNSWETTWKLTLGEALDYVAAHGTVATPDGGTPVATFWDNMESALANTGQKLADSVYGAQKLAAS